MNYKTPIKDMRFVLGGSKTAMCATFLHMLGHIYRTHCAKCTSLMPWEAYMTEYAAMLQAKGSPFDGLVVGTCLSVNKHACP